MPTAEIYNADPFDSGSSLESIPPHQINQFPERGGHFQQALSSDSSIEIEPNLENYLNIEAIQHEPHYVPIVIPVEPTFEELLKRVTGRDDIHNVIDVKLRVISYMVSLQRLPIFMPKLVTLNLEGSVIGSLRDLGCGLSDLKNLNVSNCGLRSLDGTNGLPALESLVADNNMIENVGPCCNLTELKVLSLKENNVKEIGIVSFLAMCPLLRELNLKNNPIALDQFYRRNIKRYIPSLVILDDVLLIDEIPNSSYERVESSISSTSSLESSSSLTSASKSDLEDSSKFNQPASNSQHLKPSHISSSLTLSGTILNKVRNRKKMYSSQLSVSSSSSSGSYDIQFNQQLCTSNHPSNLKLGVNENAEEDNRSNTSRASIDSLEELVNKWKLECTRKRAKN